MESLKPAVWGGVLADKESKAAEMQSLVQVQGRGTEAVKRGCVGMCRKAEREKREKEKDVVHRSAACPASRLESCSNVVRRHRHRRREAAPASGCGSGADQQGENLDGLLVGAAATFM